MGQQQHTCDQRHNLKLLLSLSYTNELTNNNCHNHLSTDDCILYNEMQNESDMNITHMNILMK